MTEYLWTEKYRPTKIADAILPEGIKATFQSMVDKGSIQNMLFHGTGGVGKTTIAKALCEELGADYLFLNGSENGNIDTLRGKIRQFASTVSLTDNQKVVIIDEADFLNAQSTQPALRGFIEEFHDNCRFILTCNYKNRILPQIHSRCAGYDFTIKKSQLPTLAGEFLARTENILKAENIPYDTKVLVELIMKHVPDWRRVLNELQRYSAAGVIDVGILTNISDTNINSLVSMIKEKDFKSMRKWVADNIDMDQSALFRAIFDQLGTVVRPESVPNAILIISEYQYKAAFVADQEINVTACLTELMANVHWK